MKIQYRHQKFQADAAKAVVDVFAGQPLEHGLDVGVGFAHTGFHLNGEVVAVGSPLQFVRRLDLMEWIAEETGGEES